MDTIALIGLIVTIFGTYIAWITYHKTFNAVPDVTEEKNNFLAVFKATQRLHLEIQSMIQNHIEQNNSANDYIMPNVTFQQSLKVLKAEYEKCLSDKLYDDLKNADGFTKSNYASLQKELENQSRDLMTTKNQLLLLL